MGNQLFMSAFFELNSGRAFGLEQGPIPWRDIHDWCELYGIEEDQKDDVMYHVRTMDNRYLKECSAKAKRDKGNG